MPQLLLTLLEMLAAGSIVVIAGIYLAKFGDAIGFRTGIGGVWIGGVLLAAATSLPELATDISAVDLGATDLAVGDLFGSSMANMLILAILDLAYPRLRIVHRAEHTNLIGGSLAVILTALAAIALALRSTATILGAGAWSLLILAAYFAGSRAIYVRASAEPGSKSSEPPRDTLSLKVALVGFAIATAGILLAAPHFAETAKRAAQITGIGDTFVGTWLVGTSTSLPEFVASLAAVRIRAFDMAVGNLFGSNAFNMILFVALDLANGGIPVLSIADPAHMITALVAIVLTATALAAIVFRAERSLTLLEPSSALMLAVYAFGLFLVYRHAVHGAT